ncbi:hypothetical protein [Nostocoides sp. Soil756]|uniref:hypothetical protein n=1 Tax=Nostocoides sp. Soil756 TaxID=1736399 RepID=UPI0007013147|nr:hypothetical protein [Tetrasphaera sp. Soil756]KRE61628.1 hypothetical protein ASG78_09785 [Tetrasphaera sp. Soil756]
MTTPRPPRKALRRAARAAAETSGGALPRWRLLELGFDHAAVQREVDAERWQALGTHTVVLHTGPVGIEARRHAAVWEVAADVALVDGGSALQAAGLTGWSDDQIHVSVPRNARCPKVDGVHVHRVARRPHEAAGTTLPRTTVEVAALRAAAWVRTDRQAALVLCLVVQQRLTTGPRLQQAFRTVRNRGRRPLVRQLLRDISDGAQSLGELDFAQLCRRYGLPEPERQVVRRTARGRIYLDVRWAGSRLVVEIDGAGHRVGLAVTDDNLRQNDIALGRDTVLRIDLVGLRIQERLFMEQVARGLALPLAA